MEIVIKRSLTLLKQPACQQIMRFGVVGVLAALTNFLVVVLLVDELTLLPLVANFFAFLIAFQVSFYGHKLWTFNSSAAYHRCASRFFLVAGFSFLLNEGFYAFFLEVVKLQYALALIIVLIMVPPITFLLSKFWAFAE